MRLERLLRSRFYRSFIALTGFQTLGVEGTTPGIQLVFNLYPRGPERHPHQTIMLPPGDAFEVARDIIRVHRGEWPQVSRDDIVADFVGLHAMSESEALMVEAIMQIQDANLRTALWQSLRMVEFAQKLLDIFVRNLGSQDAFQVAAEELLGTKEASAVDAIHR